MTASKRSSCSRSSASSPLSAIVACDVEDRELARRSAPRSRCSSSTTSTLRPRIDSSAAAESNPGTAAGSRTRKTVPRPGSLSTLICPKWRSTSDLTIDSPRPVPGFDPLRLPGRGRSGRTLAKPPPRFIPTPESATTIWTHARSASTPTWMLPSSGVYRCALVSRLATIWRTRPGSASAGAWSARRTSSRCWRLASDPRVHQLHDLVHDLADVDRAPVDLDVVGLDPRDVEQVVDEVDESIGRFEDDVDELALALGHALGRALEQLDEPLDRGQRAAQLVRGGRDELALGALEPGALAHVADRPDDALVVGSELRGGHGERAPVVLDQHLAAAARIARAAAGCPRRRPAPEDRAPGTSSVARGLTAAIVLDPGSVTISASPRLSIVTARRRRSSSIRRCAVARSSPIALNAPPRSWSSRGPDGRTRLFELALGEAVGRLDQLVERAAHRAHEHGDQRERAGEREYPGDDDQDERPARVVAGLLAGRRLRAHFAALGVGWRATVRARADR